MSEAVAAPTGGATSTFLPPAAGFPADLTGLSLTELHVLHSRIGRQLDREYLTTPSGAHPLTLERYRDLTVELDAREIVAAPHETDR